VGQSERKPTGGLVLMDKFVLDLQRFNEGEPAPQEPVVQEQANQEVDDFDIAIDENGDVVMSDAMLGNPLNKPVEQPKQQFYTPEELKQTEFEKIDPFKLPPELQELYKSMQAPFSKATQQLAQTKSQYEQFLAQQQQFQQQQQVPQVQQPTQPQTFDKKAYYNKLFETAKTVVENDFQEVFDELNPQHQTALVDAVTELKQQFYTQQGQINQVQQVISAFAQEPDWKEIDSYAKWRITKLPFEVAEPLMQRIKEGDAAALHAALSIARDELRAVKRQQQQPQIQQPQQQAKIPFVESPGSGSGQEFQRKPDYTQMRGKSTDELARMVQEWGLV